MVHCVLPNGVERSYLRTVAYLGRNEEGYHHTIVQKYIFCLRSKGRLSSNSGSIRCISF